MMIGLLGAAWSYATSAYTYNQGRFQFDAGQKQTSAHMRMNLRLAQWNLFREDVRDLFNLTTSNMSTYMVVGTLFLGFSIALIYGALKDYPLNPGWLILMYGNILFASLAFGILAVWLAMHGTVAAHSTSVKVLTQAVRPPIPTATDTENVRFTLSRYEGGGGMHMLRPPDFLGVMGESAPSSTPVVGTAGSARATGTSFAEQGPRIGHQETDRAQVEESPLANQTVSRMGSRVSLEPSPNNRLSLVPSPKSGRRPSRSPVRESESRHSAATAEEEEDDGVRELLADDEGVGPGRSAEMEKHVELFRQLQLQYSCFDAYARAALSAAANQVLLVIAYFVIGHMMVKVDVENGKPIMNRVLVWCSVFVCCVASRVLFKLDLYVSKRKLRCVKEMFVAGPLVSCLAAHLWTDARSDSRHAFHVPAPWINALAFFAAILHTIWMGIQVHQARPGVGGQLPTAFRSVQYLDVFGWQNETGADEDEQDEEESPMILSNMSEEALEAHDERILQKKMAARAMRQSRRLLSQVRQLRANASDQFTIQESRKLQEMEESLLTFRKDKPQRKGGMPGAPSQDSVMSRASGGSLGAEMWVRSSFVAESGQEVEYFINSNTGDVSWEMPKEGVVLKLSDISTTIDNLQRQLRGPEPERRVNFVDLPQQPVVVEMQETSHRSGGREEAPSESSEGRSHSRETRPSASAAAFETLGQPLMRRPGSSQSTSTMPWKYFAQIGKTLTLIWIFTVTYILIVYVMGADFDNAFTPLPAMAFQEQLEVPYFQDEHYFRPTALACTGNSLVLSDSLTFFRADIDAPIKKLDVEALRKKLPSLQKQPPWRSLAFVCEESGANCTSLLTLSSDGVTLMQHNFLSGKSVSSDPTVYTVGRRLGAEVHAIDIVIGEKAVQMCKDVVEKTRWKKSNWALHAITDNWNVVSLCPAYDTDIDNYQNTRTVPGSLEPVKLLVSLPVTTKAGRGTILGVKVREDESVWLMATNTIVSRTELQLWSKFGELINSWHLPYGRTWAPGVCQVDSKNLIFSASKNVTNSAAYPEIWHVRPTDDIPAMLALAEKTDAESSDGRILV